MSEDKKTDRYEMPKRIDRLEKQVRELGKIQREQRRLLADAFALMSSQSAGAFGQGNLAQGFKAIAEGLRDG